MHQYFSVLSSPYKQVLQTEMWRVKAELYSALLSTSLPSFLQVSWPAMAKVYGMEWL